VRRAAQVFLGSMLVRNFSYEIMVLDEYAGALLLQVRGDCCLDLLCRMLSRTGAVAAWHVLLHLKPRHI
jgi:hypothetical protein